MNKGKIQKGKLVRTSEDVRECSGDIWKLVRMVTSAYRRCGGTYRGETSELEVRRSEDVRKLDRIGKCSGDIRKLVRMVMSAYRRCGGTYRGEMSELEMKRSEEVRTLGRIGKCSGDVRKLVQTGCPLTCPLTDRLKIQRKGIEHTPRFQGLTNNESSIFLL